MQDGPEVGLLEQKLCRLVPALLSAGAQGLAECLTWTGCSINATERREGSFHVSTSYMKTPWLQQEKEPDEVDYKSFKFRKMPFYQDLLGGADIQTF